MWGVVCGVLCDVCCVLCVACCVSRPDVSLFPISYFWLGLVVQVVGPRPRELCVPVSSVLFFCPLQDARPLPTLFLGTW